MGICLQLNRGRYAAWYGSLAAPSSADLDAPVR